MLGVGVGNHESGDHLGLGVDLEGGDGDDLEGGVAVVVGRDGQRVHVVGGAAMVVRDGELALGRFSTIKSWGNVSVLTCLI